MEEVEYFCDPQQPDHHVRGFEQLMGLYHHHLLNTLRHHFSSKYDLNDLEEFAQRTWIKVWEHRGSFCAKHPRNFRSWLFTIGINEARQDFRKRRKGPGEMPAEYDHQDHLSGAPEQFAVEREQRLELYDSLQLGMGDEDLHRCLELLKSESPKWFDALVSKILDESAEDEILAKYEIDRPALHRLRWKAAQKVKDCIVGGLS